MPRFTPLAASINAGELSPRLAARTDFQKYPNGLETCENLIPLAEGGAMRRSGSRYIAELADSSVSGRIRPFQFSDDEAHILEFGEQTLRFYFRQGQLVAPNITPTITNGTFDTDTSGWTDDSTGGGSSISQSLEGSSSLGTWDASGGSNGSFGDGVANAQNAGFKFTTGATGGDVSEIRVEVNTAGNFNAAAEIWTDNAGSPGAQVGGTSDSLSMNSTGEKGFTWSSNAPTLSASTTYWAVIADQSVPHANSAFLDVAADQGSGFASGLSDTVTSISDASGGFGASSEWRMRITLTLSSADGRLNLNGAASQTAIATQQVTITETSTEHVLRFRIVGDPGDIVKLRIGTSSGGTDVIDDKECLPGWYAVSFQTTAGSVFIQFRNEVAKTVQVDDVSLIDNAAIEIGTPWTEAQLPELKFTQSADVLYVFHSSHATHKLVRQGLRSWDLSEVCWKDGPYLDTNTTDTTLTPSATTGLAVTITASSTEGINDNQGFLSTDIGRLVRIAHSGTWGWAVIVGQTSSTVVTADVQGNFAATSAVTDWRLGAWSETTGYPGVGAFFEQRLYAAASTNQPQTLWGSQTADFENMTPDDGSGTIEDDDGLNFTLSADEVNKIVWLSPGENTLTIGTTGGEWVPTSQGAVITPNDITVRRQTSHGSADIAPVRIGQVVLFVQKAKRKLRELAFRFETDGYVAADMTRLAQHITKGGLSEIAYQQEPESLVWGVRGDGTLLSMTFRRDEDVVAWSRHILGGAFSGGQAVVESAAAIPGFDDTDQIALSGDRDELWLIVKRTINSQTKRYIEILERDYETGDDVDDVYYSDSLITYDGASTTSISVPHLEGQTVKVWADGFPVDDATVSSGSITLSTAASTVQVGLGFTHTMKRLKVEGGNPAGTAVTRTKRISDVSAVLLNAHRLKIRVDDKLQKTKTFRTAGSDALYTGETDPLSLEADWSRDPRIIVSDDLPGPFTFLAAVPHISENPLK